MLPPRPPPRPWLAHHLSEQVRPRTVGFSAGHVRSIASNRTTRTASSATRDLDDAEASDDPATSRVDWGARGGHTFARKCGKCSGGGAAVFGIVDILVKYNARK